MQLKPSYLTSDCTGLPDGWTDVEHDANFPVPHNTAITVSCPTGYEEGGDTSVTCDEDEIFTYTTEPSCTKWSKSFMTFSISVFAILLSVVNDKSIKINEHIFFSMYRTT